MKNRILLSSPTMHEEEMNFIKEAFEKNWIAPLGFNVDAFEEEMKAYVGEETNNLALCSGSAALHLAVKLAGIKRGDKVLCSDMTFAATVNPVSYEGGEQVFVDSERETWNIDPEALEEAFVKHPTAKAVILVHLYGTPAKVDEIVEICRRHNAVLIEDAAESLAAEYKGRKTGALCDYGIFSFNGNKIITTSGGGMLLTKNAADREKAFFWATQSREKAYWYQHEEIGYNYRMSNVVAGIGRGQLLHLEEHRDKKQAIYENYKEAFGSLPISMNPYLPYTKPNFWLSCLLFDRGVKRSPIELLEFLAENGIESRPIWKPMHMQPVFSKNHFITVGDKSVDEDVFARGLCLPSDIKMTESDQAFVIEKIKEFFAAKC